MIRPLTISCPECSGFGTATTARDTSIYGTGFFYEETCPECDGEAEVEATCLTCETVLRSDVWCAECGLAILEPKPLGDGWFGIAA